MFKVVLIGRSNVGKSTLFNRLVGKKLALTSPTAGTTRDTTQGEVAWRNEENYGGAFGVRFLEIDEQSLVALRNALGERTEEM